jgi:hypothetical protein
MRAIHGQPPRFDASGKNRRLPNTPLVLQSGCQQRKAIKINGMAGGEDVALWHMIQRGQEIKQKGWDNGK